MSGNLFIISAPSGVGKTTLVATLLRQEPRVRPSVSFTARPPRPKERHGVDYHFVSVEEFRAMIARDELLEWAEVHGRLYGTSRQYVAELLAQGYDVTLTIDVQGAALTRAIFPGATSVFILPPSFEVMMERLTRRATNDADDLQVRLQSALAELARIEEFDYVIINDDLNQAVRELRSIIIAARCRTERRGANIQSILNTFKEAQNHG